MVGKLMIRPADSKVGRPATEKILNGVFFQAAWLACVIGGASGFWWAGPLAVVAFAAWQIPRSESPLKEVILGSIAVAVGLVFDTALIRLGLVAYPHPGPTRLTAPVWILALWFGFSLTLNHSLSWLHNRLFVAGLLGGLSGPLSYWIGATTWGAIELTAPSTTILSILALGWGIMTPALLAISKKIGKPIEATGNLNDPNPAMAVPFSNQSLRKNVQGEQS